MRLTCARLANIEACEHGTLSSRLTDLSAETLTEMLPNRALNSQLRPAILLAAIRLPATLKQSQVSYKSSIEITNELLLQLALFVLYIIVWNSGFIRKLTKACQSESSFWGAFVGWGFCVCFSADFQITKRPTLALVSCQ